MASMRDIQRRRNSIASTQQITKAMKLVSTVKLQRTREKAEECKPYFNHMYATVTSMLARTGIVEHPYLKSGKSGKKGVIVISSNRGLAGGYNSNIVKMLTQGELEGKELLIYNIGRKGHEALERKGYEIAEDYSEVINAPLYSDAVEISQRVLKDFEEEKIGEIYLVYTSFKNTVVHEPKLLKLLPVEFSDKELSDAERNTPMNYKPGEEEALDMIIPKYIASLLYARRLHHLKTIVLKTFHIVLHNRIEVHIGVHRRCNDLLTGACKCRRCQHVIRDPVCKLSYYIGTCRCDHEKICSLCQ